MTFFIPPVVVFLFAGLNGILAHLNDFLLIYFIFGTLLYGGLYTLNGIADRKTDSKDRPLVSGAVSVRASVIIAALHITASLILVVMYLPNFTYYWLLFLLLNVIYTFVLKKYWRAGAIFLIPLTMLLRAKIGLDLVGVWGPEILLLLVGFYLSLIGVYTKWFVKKGFLKKSGYLTIGRVLVIGAIVYGLVNYSYTKNWIFVLLIAACIVLDLLANTTKTGKVFLKY